MKTDQLHELENEEEHREPKTALRPEAHTEAPCSSSGKGDEDK